MKKKETIDVITKEDVLEADKTLQEYKKGKDALEKRIIANENWFRLRHWNDVEEANDKLSKPVSAWLHNSITNKHADMMDNYPEPTVLPREESDYDSAKVLTQVLPVVLEHNNYEQTYSDTAYYKLKQGTGVKKIVWNPKKNNGLGDIDIQRVELLNLFWEPGISDIQKSRNVFHVELVDNDLLKENEKLKDSLTTAGDKFSVSKYEYEDSVDTTEKSLVVDWYYKKAGEDEKTVLHYVKYVKDVILYASENDPKCAETGFYEHGLYPYVFDVLFPVEGSPCGFGYIDTMKDCQGYIDKLNQAVLQTTIVNATPRYFVNRAGSINEEEFSDHTKTFVHVDGNLGEDSVRQITTEPISGNVMNVLSMKVDELKETSGNRDFSQGSTASGVTAASAIAALQEAGSKLSRDMLKSTYRAFREECYFAIELIRQFYDEPRVFRVIGDLGAEEFVTFDNAQIKEHPQGKEMGVDLGDKLPVFDVKVDAAKKSTYSRMAQNELAIQFYNMGLFNPQMADQASTCLKMMDFEGKDKIEQKVSQNGTLYQQLMQMQQQLQQLAMVVDTQNGTNMQAAVAQIMQPGQMQGSLPQNDLEPAQTKKAKERVAKAAQPK